MTVSITDLYEILSAKLGKDEAKALVNFVEEKVEKEIENQTKNLATKEDVKDLEIKLEKGFKEQNGSRLTTFIVTVVMILGLYAAIWFKG